MNLLNTVMSERFGAVELDFEEEFDIAPDCFQEDKLTRPAKPMEFKVGPHLVEVHYRKGLYPQLVCSCHSPPPCPHILALEEEVFPKILWEIFEQCGGNYNKEYLKHELAQKIRTISPRSERPIMEYLIQKMKGKKDV